VNDEDDESSDVKLVKPISSNQVTMFKHINTAIGTIDDNDASRERTAKVTRVTESAVAYKELYSERYKAACQLSLHHFFKRLESCQSTGSA
jgi:hypothetical protein